MGVLAVVTIPHRSGIAKHNFSNSFAVGQGIAADAFHPAGWEEVMATRFADFYRSGAPTGALSLAAAYLSGEVSPAVNAASVKLYNLDGQLDGSPHGSPIHVKQFTMNNAADPGGAPGLPSEVCCAVTLEAAGRGNQRVEAPDGADPGVAVDRPRQRFTGRFYFGPLRNSPDCVVNDANGSALISNTLRTDLLDAVEWLAEGLNADNPDEWLGVWSRADERIRSIDAVSIDNAPDTQRRRGITATSRTSRVIAVGADVELAA